MGSFEEELLIDGLIRTNLKTDGPRLPTYGRDLVPYFLPGSEDFVNNSYNMKDDGKR